MRKQKIGEFSSDFSMLSHLINLLPDHEYETTDNDDSNQIGSEKCYGNSLMWTKTDDRKSVTDYQNTNIKCRTKTG